MKIDAMFTAYALIHIHKQIRLGVFTEKIDCDFYCICTKINSHIQINQNAYIYLANILFASMVLGPLVINQLDHLAEKQTRNLIQRVLSTSC